MIRRVLRQRGHAVTASGPACGGPPRTTRARAFSSAYVSSPAGASIATRAGVFQSAVAEPAAEGQVAAHPRNPLTTSTKRVGCSQKRRCPQPSNSVTLASGICVSSSSAFRWSTTASAVPWRTSVGAVIAGSRSKASNVAPAEACASHAAGSARLPAGARGSARRSLRALPVRARSRRTAGARRAAPERPPRRSA